MVFLRDLRAFFVIFVSSFSAFFDEA